MPGLDVVDPELSVEVLRDPATIAVKETAWGLEIQPGEDSWLVKSNQTLVEVVPGSGSVEVGDGSVSVELVAIGGSGGSGGGAYLPILEDLVFNYTDGLLTSIDGETYTRTLTYDAEDRVETITDSDTEIVQTLTYDVLTGLPLTRTIGTTIVDLGGYILTESGDTLITEAGDLLILNLLPVDDILLESGDVLLVEAGDNLKISES